MRKIKNIKTSTELKKIKPIHPGEILEEEFLLPYKISKYRLAKDICVPPIRITEIVNGKRNITVDTALRLGKYFGNSPEFWINLQSSYDLRVAEKSMSNILKNDVKIFKLAI